MIDGMWSHRDRPGNEREIPTAEDGVLEVSGGICLHKRHHRWVMMYEGVEEFACFKCLDLDN